MQVDALAQLDDARPATLNDATWLANLAALRRRHAALASRLQQTPLPATWRTVESLDGFVTFRTDSPGQPARWLAASAAPLTRANALLAMFQPGEHNPSLPTIGAGTELMLLLERLPAHKAVFVFERDLSVLGAVLRTLDLAADIAGYRCILVPADRPGVWLAELLEAYPGLLPPGNILQFPHVSPDWIAQLRSLCEQLGPRTARRRAQRLAELAQSVAGAGPTASATPRVALLALAPDHPAPLVSRWLARAAEQLGWEVRRCAADGPRNVHPLAHVEALADFGPALTICVNHPRGRFPAALPGAVCEWYLATADVPEQLADDGTWRLAATPKTAAALRAAAGSERGVLAFYWGCDPAEAAEPKHAARRAAVVLVGDLPDASDEACGIDQAALQRLWQELHALVGRRCESAEIRFPDNLLRAAEHASGARLREATVRSQMLRLIEYVLIPAVVLERILQTLKAECPQVLVVGRGWRRVSGHVDTLTEDVGELSQALSETQPTAAVFAGRHDPLSPELLCAGAVGTPLLLHQPHGARLAAELGDVLKPGEHYRAFCTAKELRAALHALREKPDHTLRLTRRTRTHLLENHTYAHRLEALRKKGPGGFCRT